MNRYTNYSPEELEMLIQCLEEKKYLVSSELGAHCHTAQELKKEWENVAQRVSSVGLGSERTASQIKTKWSDLIYRVKQKFVKEKKSGQKTGGGPLNFEFLTPLEERMLSLMGKTSVFGVTPENYGSSYEILKVNKITYPLTQEITSYSTKIVLNKLNIVCKNVIIIIHKLIFL